MVTGWLNVFLIEEKYTYRMRRCLSDVQGPVLITVVTLLFFFFFKRFYLFIFRERKGWRKRGRETSECGCLCAPPTGDLARNPGTCPDWESNWRPFGSQASAQSTEPHQPGQLLSHFLTCSMSCCIFSCR